MSETHPPHRVLFVCLGNICRSPAAEIILRKQASDAGRSAEFEIDSAGTIGFHHGSPPDSRMTGTLERLGYEVSGTSRQISAEDLESFDVVIPMDETNLADVLALDPSGKFHPKVRTLVSFCREYDVPRVPDPYYGGQKGFEHVIHLLEDACTGILADLGR